MEPKFKVGDMVRILPESSGEDSSVTGRVVPIILVITQHDEPGYVVDVRDMLDEDWGLVNRKLFYFESGLEAASE